MTFLPAVKVKRVNYGDACLRPIGILNGKWQTDITSDGWPACPTIQAINIFQLGKLATRKTNLTIGNEVKSIHASP